jgi:hypothetical protein
MGIEIGTGIQFGGGITITVLPPSVPEDITTEANDILLTESNDNITTE